MLTEPTGLKVWQATARVWFMSSVSLHESTQTPIQVASRYILAACERLNRWGQGPGFTVTIREAFRTGEDSDSGRLFEVTLISSRAEYIDSDGDYSIAKDILDSFADSKSSDNKLHFRRVELLVGNTQHIWAFT